MKKLVLVMAFSLMYVISYSQKVVSEFYIKGAIRLYKIEYADPYKNIGFWRYTRKIL